MSCYNRVCAPLGGVVNRPDAGTDTTSDINFDVRPDMILVCRPGERFCDDDLTVVSCWNGRFQEEMCVDGSFCSAGECVHQVCEDNDGDGYGRGCRLGNDCDDTDGRVNPGQREICNNRADDNCDGEVNENCD